MDGLRVLVTRPAHQSENLARCLRSANAFPILFPTIEIKSSNECQNTLHLKENIGQYDIALFVSQNAVQYAFKTLDAKSLPEHLKIGVIGKGSLESLKQYGIKSNAMPDQTYNSEGLLASNLLLDVKNKNIIIFRGQAGRNLLGDTLIERGAKITYCEVYQRCLPIINEDSYTNTFNKPLNLAIFTSSEGLEHAFKMIKATQAAHLLQIPWLLISSRMKKTAYHLGHNSDIIIAHQASDDGIMSALQEWALARE